MKTRGLISIIIPAYNAESTISNIINDVLNQTYKNIELIIINDGSTDDTAKIVKSLNNIKLITTKNAGQGAARNLGIKVATGEYIGFCDADDEIEPKMYENLVRMIESTNSDMVGCGHCDLVNNGLIEHRSTDSIIMNRETALSNFALQKGIKWAVWDKLFKAERIGNIRFTNDRLHAEDCMFLLEFIKVNKSFYYEDLGLYHYRRDNKESYTKRKWNKARIGLTIFYKSLYETLKTYNVSDCIDTIQSRYYENLLSTFIRSYKYGYNDMYLQIKELMTIERPMVWSSKQLNFLYKLDFLICCIYPKLALNLNFWYK